MTARIMLGSVFAIALVGGVAAAPLDSGPEDVVSIEIPLEDGRLQIRTVVEHIYQTAGVEPPFDHDWPDWVLDLGSTHARHPLQRLERYTSGTVTVEIGADQIVLRLHRQGLKAYGDRIVDVTDAWLLEAESLRRGRRNFGMQVATRGDPRSPLLSLPGGTRRVVVLIHGLDDPGWMWRDLIPALLRDGHVVLRFEYPNDQPIADCSDLLATELMTLRRLGIRRASIVAHSMGGLVARDVLTRRAFYGGDGRGGRRFPAVDRLIMVGPPNAGSPLARLRGLAEVREQLSRWISGEGSWLGALEDGAGEAGRDLLPESDFLRRLNARPRPRHTEYTIVAGQISPVSRRDVEALTRRWRRITGFSRDSDRVSQLVGGMVEGLGDGVVSIESARLAGVEDFVIVEANHLSMIVNAFSTGSTPPAIPIVLERLEE